MLRSFLRIAWRNMVKQRGTSLVNIGGLAIGITCSMLILMWVRHELSFDQYHENADEIYRVVGNQHFAGGQLFPVAQTPSALASVLKRQFPEVTHASRFVYRSMTLKQENRIFTEAVALFDPEILNILAFSFRAGDPASALSQPHSLILTQTAAFKYFGEIDVLGKTLRVDGQNDFLVTGVIDDIPDNSHLRFEVMAPFEYLGELGSSLNDWNSNWCYTYVLLRKDAEKSAVDSKIRDLVQQHKETTTEINLQSLGEIHLNSAGKYSGDIGGHGDIQYIRIFSVIAVFILLIASINFMNLATARSERRAKEVGLRKAVGANRLQIIRQFFGEAILQALLALLVAALFTELLLPIFNGITGKSLALNQSDLTLLISFTVIALITGVISGSYPALYLSSFRPAEALKGLRSRQSNPALFRKVLVVIQFTLSLVMIVGTLTVSRQIEYIHSKDLGLDKENLAYIWMSGEFRQQRDAARQMLLTHPNISDVTFSSQPPTRIVSAKSGWNWPGKSPNDEVLMHLVGVDYDYVKTHKMTMAQGRFFSRDFTTDSLAAVINQTALETMGVESALGLPLNFGNNNLTIIGVVKDFHFQSVHNKIEPLVLVMAPRLFYAMIMRVRPEGLSATMSFVEQIYSRFNPETPFYFNFLETDYGRLYRTEERIGAVSRYFAIIAIAISCLGLYGLASYTAEHRTKEIGIRKVLGASVPAVLLLLSRTFVGLVGIAILIAWPLAYLITAHWLQNYAYRTPMHESVFLIAAAIALGIVCLTVIYQAWRAALANPVDSLHHE